MGDDADPRYLKSAVGLVWRVVMFWLFMIAVISLAWWGALFPLFFCAVRGFSLDEQREYCNLCLVIKETPS